MIMDLHQASAKVSAPYFRIDAEPGRRQLVGTIQLFNRTSRRLAVRLDPVDAITANDLDRFMAQSASRFTDRPVAASWQSSREHPRRREPTVSWQSMCRLSRGRDFLSGISVQSIQTLRF